MLISGHNYATHNSSATVLHKEAVPLPSGILWCAKKVWGDETLAGVKASSVTEPPRVCLVWKHFVVSSQNMVWLSSALHQCLQCFDTVGWAARRASSPWRIWGDGGGGHWLVRMEWRPAGWLVSASVNLPLHHKVQKLSSGTGSPGWSRKKSRKMVVVCWWWYINAEDHQLLKTKSLGPATAALSVYPTGEIHPPDPPTNLLFSNSGSAPRFCSL